MQNKFFLLKNFYKKLIKSLKNSGKFFRFQMTKQLPKRIRQIRLKFMRRKLDSFQIRQQTGDTIIQ